MGRGNFKLTNLISLIITGLSKLVVLYFVHCGSLYFLSDWCISSKLSNLCLQSGS